MDLPIHFEAPQLSHSDLMSVLVPIGPGTVIWINLILGHHQLLRSFQSAGLGYKTSVLGSLIVCYLGGAVACEVIDNITAFLLSKLTGSYPSPDIQTNPYLRKVVKAYLGEELLPDETADDDYEVAETLLIAAGYGKSSNLKQLAKIAADIAKAELKLKEMKDGPEKTKYEETLLRMKTNQVALSNEAKELFTDGWRKHQWFQVLGALILNLPYNPVAQSQDRILLGIQAASVTELAFWVSVKPYLHFGFAVFTGAILVLVLLKRTHLYRSNNTLERLNAFTLNALFEKLKARETTIPSKP